MTSRVEGNSSLVEPRVIREDTVRQARDTQCDGSTSSCGCHETYPQLQAGRINHHPTCPNVKVTAPFVVWRYGTVTFLAARHDGHYSICDDAGSYYGAWRDVETFRSRQRNGGDWNPLMGRAAVTVRCL